MEPTAYKGVNSLAAELLGRLAGVLGSNLGGLYLFGSAAAGAFEDGVSDVDLLAVTLEGLTNAQFANLHAMHHALAREYPAWDDRIELLYVSAAGLRECSATVSNIVGISHCPSSIGSTFSADRAAANRNSERGITVTKRPVASSV